MQGPYIDLQRCPSYGCAMLPYRPSRNIWPLTLPSMPCGNAINRKGRTGLFSLSREGASPRVAYGYGHSTFHRRIGDGKQGGHVPPPPKKKKSEKIFFWQLSCKIWAFFGQMSCKIRAFCYFFIHIFGQNILPQSWQLLRLWHFLACYGMC